MICQTFDQQSLDSLLFKVNRFSFGWQGWSNNLLQDMSILAGVLKPCLLILQKSGSWSKVVIMSLCHRKCYNPPHLPDWTSFLVGGGGGGRGGSVANTPEGLDPSSKSATEVMSSGKVPAWTAATGGSCLPSWLSWGVMKVLFLPPWNEATAPFFYQAWPAWILARPALSLPPTSRLGWWWPLHRNDQHLSSPFCLNRVWHDCFPVGVCNITHSTSD